MTNVRIFILGVIILANVAQCEVFTSVEDLTKLLRAHENVISNLKLFVEREERRMKFFKRYLHIFTEEHEKAIEDPQKYVENPIKAFTLIKRLTTDLYIVNNVALNGTELTWDRELLFPTEEDLAGAAVAIARLQQYYNLETVDLAEGKFIAGFGDPMTMTDCFELGRNLFEKKEYKYAAEWFITALDKVNTEDIYANASQVILRDIALTLHETNVTLDPTAYEYAKKLFAINPEVDDTDTHLQYFKDAYDKERADDKNEQERMNKERQICRGEIDISAANASKLHCSYLKRTPALRLVPIKMEEIHKNPDIFLFHDVISDKEIDEIKAISIPMMKRARATDESGKVNNIDSRVCKSAPLTDEDLVTIADLAWRAHDFTGLSIISADPLQVHNYGIGGYNNEHYDYHQNSDIVLDFGNRIATVLFYMSDVGHGGATVFPQLNLSVKPKKGTALFWMNLHPSGEFDTRTVHAACPVLNGNKWTSTIWLHEAGQELLRSCLVQETH